MSKRKFAAVIELDEEVMEQHIKNVGMKGSYPGEYLEREFGWIEPSGLSLKDWLICDKDDSLRWARYIDYLIEWAFNHRGEESAGMYPACYDEWCENEDRASVIESDANDAVIVDTDIFDDVIDGGKNIKMKNMTGCGVSENWTIDDCETKCPKYYGCYAVSLANDVLKKYEDNCIKG